MRVRVYIYIYVCVCVCVCVRFTVTFLACFFTLYYVVGWSWCGYRLTANVGSPVGVAEVVGGVSARVARKARFIQIAISTFHTCHNHTYLNRRKYNLKMKKEDMGGLKQTTMISIKKSFLRFSEGQLGERG